MSSRLTLLVSLCAGFFLVVGLLPAETASAQADEPLHVQIDRLLQSEQLGPVAEKCSDAEFIRRVWLDLAGTIPPADEVRRFLEDQSPNKRAALVDRLLASPAYVRHMTDVFDVMLMERRRDTHVKRDEWRGWLQTAIRENRPYNVLVREILAADGVDPAARAPAKFVLDRSADPNLLVRDIGRIFFGIDLQCAQCHDHPLIDDYLQADYYGLFAFVSGTSIFQPDKKKPAVLAEKAPADVSFKSAFGGDEQHTLPRLPGGPEIEEPTFPKGEEYKVKPDKNVRPVPKFSRRQALAELATNGSNRAFNRNIANRLWALMMGRGLVEPVDLHHPENPPASPVLLDLLADRFAAMNYDVRAFLRELALTEVYQRSFRMPPELEAQIPAVVGRLPSEESAVQNLLEQVEAASAQYDELADAEQSARDAIPGLNEAFNKANEALAAAKKTADEAAKALSETQKTLAARRETSQALAEALAKAQLAAKKVGDDKELAQAVATIADRAKRLAAEVDSLSKKADEQSKTAEAARAKLTEAQKSAEAAQKALADARKKLRDLQAAVVQARSAWMDLRARANAAQRRIERIQLLADYDAKRKAHIAAVDAARKLEGELAEANKGAASAAEILAKATTDRDNAKTAHAQVVKTLEQAKGVLAAKQEIHTLLSESLAKAETALQKVPDDADVREGVVKLKAGLERAGTVVEEARAAVAKREIEAKAAAEQLAAAEDALAKAQAAAKTAQEAVAALNSRLADARAAIEKTRQAEEQAYIDLANRFSESFVVTGITPLTAEQLGWSVLQATGMVDRQRKAVVAELDKKEPLKPEDAKDPAKVQARQERIEQLVYDKLKGNVNRFVQLFANAAGQPQNEFFATIDQALFFSNGGEVRSWLAPGGGNLTERLLKIEDPAALAEEMYLAILSRLPEDSEKADVAAYLKAREKQRNAAVQELAWALLTSTEFRFRH